MGENYEHRKQWVVEQLKKLSEVFAIDNGPMRCSATIIASIQQRLQDYQQEIAGKHTPSPTESDAVCAPVGAYWRFLIKPVKQPRNAAMPSAVGFPTASYTYTGQV